MKLKQRLIYRCESLQDSIKKLQEQFEKTEFAVDSKESVSIGNRLNKRLKKLKQRTEIFQKNIELIDDDKIKISICDEMRNIHEYISRLINKIKDDDCKNKYQHYKLLLHDAKEQILTSLIKLKSYTALNHLLPEEIEVDPEIKEQTEKLQQLQTEADADLSFQEALKQVSVLTTQAKANVSCFISYAWNSDERPWEAWVQPFLMKLRDHLTLANIRVLMDIFDSNYGFNSNHHMDEIDNCHYVILIGTESLLDKFKRGYSAVCSELNRIRQRRQKDTETQKFTVIPIIVSGTMETALPVEYMRFTVIESFLKNYALVLRDLLRKLYDYGNNHTIYNQIWKKCEQKHPDWFTLPDLVYSPQQPITKKLILPNPSLEQIGKFIRAAQDEDIDQLKELLEQGIDVNVRDEVTKATALHWAAISQQVDVTKFLLDNAADPTIMNSNDETPIDLASPTCMKLMKDYLRYKDINPIRILKEKYLDPMYSQLQTLFSDERLFNKSIPVNECYVNLAIIKQEEQEKKEEALKKIPVLNEIEESPLHEFLFTPNVTIELENILEECKKQGKNTRRIAIIGCAGIGKSTLCQYITCLHALGKLWKNEYDAIFWIKLRELNEINFSAQRQYDLEEIILRTCFRQYNSCDVPEFNQFIKSLRLNPEKFLFIIDGYDELPTVAESGHLKKTVDELLSQKHILLTSRPVGKLNVFHADLTLQIIGFTNNNIEKYIEKSFEHEKEKGKTFSNFIRHQPLLSSLAHIPINLELISNIWRDENFLENNNFTLTELYQHITRWLFKRYLKKQEVNVTNILETNIEEKCEEVPKILEAIAWQAILKNKIYLEETFMVEITKKILPSLDDQKIQTKLNIVRQQCGFLVPATKVRNCYFLHLTFQEFFAARFFANAFKNAKHNPEAYEAVRKLFIENKFNPRFQIVWWFVAGCLPQNDTFILKLFYDLLFSQPRDFLQLYEIPLFIRCAEESKVPVDRVPRLYLLIQQVENWVNTETDYRIENNFIIALQNSPNLIGKSKVFEKLREGIQNQKIGIDVVQSYARKLGSLCHLSLQAMEIFFNMLKSPIFVNHCNAMIGLCCLKIDSHQKMTDLISMLLEVLEKDNIGIVSYLAAKLIIHLKEMLPRENLPEIIDSITKNLWLQNFNMSTSVVKVTEVFREHISSQKMLEIVQSFSKEIKNPDKVKCAVIALGRLKKSIPETEIFGIINELFDLKDHQREIIPHICKTIGNLAERVATDHRDTVSSYLLHFLEDQDENVKLEAAKALMKNKISLTLEQISKIISKLCTILKESKDEKNCIQCIKFFKKFKKIIPEESKPEIVGNLLNVALAEKNQVSVASNALLLIILKDWNYYDPIKLKEMEHDDTFFDYKNLSALFNILINSKKLNAEKIKELINYILREFLESYASSSTYFYSNQLRWYENKAEKHIPVNDTALFYQRIKLLQEAFFSELHLPMPMGKFLAKTSLHEALANNVEDPESLNKHKAHINNQENDERLTPLMLATYKGNIATIKFLINNDANINLNRSDKNGDPESAIQIAAQSGHWKVLEYLLVKRQAWTLLDIEHVLNTEVNYPDWENLLETDHYFNLLTSQLTGYSAQNIQRLWVREHKIYLAHINALKGSIPRRYGDNAGPNLEGLSPNDFLLLHLRNNIEILKRLELGKLSKETSAIDNLVDIICFIKKEICTALETLTVILMRDLINFNKASEQNKKLLQQALAQQLIFNLEKLLPDNEYIIQCGTQHHCVYLCFLRKENYLIVRVDDLYGVTRHDIPKSEHNKAAKPLLLGRLKLTDLAMPNTKEWLENLFELNFSMKIFQANKQPFSSNKNFQQDNADWPNARLQVTGNCVYYSFAIGMKCRAYSFAKDKQKGEQFFNWLLKKESDIVSYAPDLNNGQNQSSKNTNNPSFLYGHKSEITSLIPPTTLEVSSTKTVENSVKNISNLNRHGLFHVDNKSSRDPTVELMNFFVIKLGVSLMEVTGTTGIVIEQLLVNMAGIHHTQTNAQFWCNNDNTTSFKLRLTKEKLNLFCQYYQKQFPEANLKIETLNETWTKVTINTDCLKNKITPALKNYREKQLNNKISDDKICRVM